MPATVDRPLTLAISSALETTMSWIRPWLPPGKADLIPVKILTEVFLLTLKDWPQYRRILMLVCRRWHAIILSIPGIHAQLTIRRATQKEVVLAFIQGRKSRLHVRVDMSDETDGSDFNAENFLACLMAAVQAASRWSALSLISPPPHGEYKAVQILQPLEHLETFKVGHGFGEFLEQVMTTISNSAPPNLTTMDLADPVAVLYLVQPAGLHITHSLTTLRIQLSERTDSLVDILPHFQRLEIFEASHLCLPFYPPDASLPLTHTLRSLTLRSVSIQWMAGHVFPALEQCQIESPHHVDSIQALQPVSMPSCFHLVYNSNDLHPLIHFHLPSLRLLAVKSGQWNVLKGDPQLAAPCPVAAAGAKGLTSLTLDVEFDEQLLVHMLSLVPALKELSLGLDHPKALSTAFFQEFIAREPNADGASGMVVTSSQAVAPLCPSLESLLLHYRRWLRGPDEKALIVALAGTVASRLKSWFGLILRFDEPPDSHGLHYDEHPWSIYEPARKLQHLEDADLILGIATPHGIIPVSTWLPLDALISLPFIEADSLRLSHSDPFEFLFTHDRMDLVLYEDHPPALPTSLPCDFPLFSALRVLVVEDANPSFLAGHTFHRLDRCRVVNPSGASPSPFTETKMPVCTRVDVDDPGLLATFKLPQIYELALNFSSPDCSTIWEKHIAVNVNL
jgi:hypothetical protein